MKVWTCNSFDGHWPVGTAAVVVAETAEEARQLLERELFNSGLPQQIAQEEIDALTTDAPGVVILCNGDY